MGRSDGHGCQVDKWAIGTPKKSTMSNERRESSIHEATAAQRSTSRQGTELPILASAQHIGLPLTLAENRGIAHVTDARKQASSSNDRVEQHFFRPGLVTVTANIDRSRSWTRAFV